MADKTATVKKLLQKAERAATIAEAEAYREKATALMVQYAIDEAALTAEGRSTDVLGSRRLVFSGYAKPKSILLAGISAAFGARTILLHSSGGQYVCVVYGWESDLDTIDVLFASLVVQAEREARMTHAQNRHVNGRTWMTSFLVGFASTVTGRLRAQKASAVRQTGSGSGTELALFDRSQAVDRQFRAAHPRTRRGQDSRVTTRSGYYSGREAGQRADIGNARIGNRRTAIHA